MKPITNLNFLKESQIITDKFGEYYVVLEKRIYSTEHLCQLKLMEVNENFTIVTMTVPIACDENHEYVSVNDKSFVYKFYETNITKIDVAEQLLKVIKRLDKFKASIVENPKEDTKTEDNEEIKGTNN